MFPYRPTNPATTAEVSSTHRGLMSVVDKVKIDTVASGAQVNVLEGVTGTAPIVAGAITAKSQDLSIVPATSTVPGSMSAADKAKLDGYPAAPTLAILGKVVVGAGGVASISFTAIPATYRDLQFRLTGRADTAAVLNIGVYVQLNGDTTANYDQQQHSAQAATSAAAETLATATPVVGLIPAATAVAGGAGTILADVPDYAGAWNKMVHSRSGRREANATAGLVANNVVVGWRSGAAITSILLAPTSGAFLQNTVAVLYGVRDA